MPQNQITRVLKVIEDDSYIELSIKICEGEGKLIGYCSLQTKVASMNERTLECDLTEV